MPHFVTIMDVLRARRAAKGLPEKEFGYDEEEFTAQGLQMLGGCYDCRETLGAHNAFPSRKGVWACEECLDENGFETVEDFENHPSEAADGSGSPHDAQSVV